MSKALASMIYYDKITIYPRIAQVVINDEWYNGLWTIIICPSKQKSFLLSLFLYFSLIGKAGTSKSEFERKDNNTIKLEQRDIMY
jgi:hypothetical protein